MPVLIRHLRISLHAIIKSSFEVIMSWHEFMEGLVAIVRSIVHKVNKGKIRYMINSLAPSFFCHTFMIFILRPGVPVSNLRNVTLINLSMILYCSHKLNGFQYWMLMTHNQWYVRVCLLNKWRVVCHVELLRNAQTTLFCLSMI